MAIKFTLDDAKVLAELWEKQENMETALKRTMSDIRSRGPSWVAKGVSEKYNITQANAKKKARVKATGDMVTELNLKYRGSMMNASDFKMTPKRPKPSTYTIKAEIIRGRATQIGKVEKLKKKERSKFGLNFTRRGSHTSPESPFMLRKHGKGYEPFKRTTQTGKPSEIFKVISVPQMIQQKSGKVTEQVSRHLNDNIQKRWDNHMKNV